MDIIAMIQAVPGVGPVLPYVLMVFGICAVVAAQLPPPGRTGSVYDGVYRLINFLAHNYNYASNAAAASSKPTAATPPTIPPSASTSLALCLALSLPFWLNACSGAASGPAGDVAALEAGLTAAEGVATAYIELPACTGSNGPLCSTTSIVAQIKTADAQAYTLVKAAEQAAGDPTALSAAEAALTALTAITSTLPKQGS